MGLQEIYDILIVARNATLSQVRDKYLSEAIQALGEILDELEPTTKPDRQLDLFDDLETEVL